MSAVRLSTTHVEEGAWLLDREPLTVLLAVTRPARPIPTELLNCLERELALD
jgi:hypothetical protein